MALTLAQRIVEIAKAWVIAKVIFRHRGTTRSGCDCTGLLIGVLKELGYKNYTLPYYARDWNLHSTERDYAIEELEKIANLVPKEEVQAGDFVVFKFGRKHSHCGIYIGELLFIHTYHQAAHCKYGVLRNSIWAQRWSLVYRLDKCRLDASYL